MAEVELTAPLLFVGADEREFTGFLTHWTSVGPFPRAVHWGRRGYLKGRPVVGLVNGAGADRAFAAALLAGAVSGVCNIGFCGALDETLDVADIVVANAVTDGTETWTASDPWGSPKETGLVITSPKVVSTADEKAALRVQGGVAVEMEAAGLARAAQDLGVPFYCVRAVTDKANEDFASDFNAALQEDGRFSVAKLAIGALLSRPKLNELLELRRRSEVASKKLGDFLASCKF